MGIVRKALKICCETFAPICDDEEDAEED